MIKYVLVTKLVWAVGSGIPDNVAVFDQIHHDTFQECATAAANIAINLHKLQPDPYGMNFICIPITVPE